MNEEKVDSSCAGERRRQRAPPDSFIRVFCHKHVNDYSAVLLSLYVI